LNRTRVRSLSPGERVMCSRFAMPNGVLATRSIHRHWVDSANLNRRAPAPTKGEGCKLDALSRTGGPHRLLRSPDHCQHSFRDSAALVGRAPNTVARYVRARDDGGLKLTPVQRAQLIDASREKIDD
jgi:hypothetical protein